MRIARYGLVCLLLAVFGPVLAAGAPLNMSDVTVDPTDELWMNQEFTLQGACTPTTESTMYVDNITHIYESPTFYPTSDELTFAVSGNTRVLSYGKIKPYLTQPGAYTVNVRCDKTTDDSSASRSVDLSLKRLHATFEENSVPETAYGGMPVQAEVVIREDPSSTLLDSGVSFDAAIKKDGGSWQDLTIHTPTPYYTDGAWLLNVTLPEAPGDYTFRITATYNGGSATAQQGLTIHEEQDVTISVAKKRVSSRESNTVTVEATHRGQPVTVREEDITVAFDGDDIDDVITEKASAGESRFSFRMPTRSPDTYELDIVVDTGSVSASKSVDIEYPIAVTGRFESLDGKPYEYDLSLQDDGDEVLGLSGSGGYSGEVLPGTYGINLQFKQAQLIMRSAVVEDWDDAIRYVSYPLNSLPGMELAGLYAFETGLAFNDADVTMAYNTKNIDDPDEIRIYRCQDWNTEGARCSGSWTGITGEFNTVNDEVSIETGTLAAYAIGVREELRISYTLDDSTFLPGDTVTMIGRILDQRGRAVSDAQVTARIPEADVAVETTSSSDGSYEVTFPAPDDQRSYTVTLTAAKEPFADGERKVGITVQRPAGMNVVVPDGITVKANSSKTVTAYIENTGYRELSGLQAVTDDVPFVTKTSFNAQPLAPGDNREITLTLTVPADAGAKTHTATFRMNSDQTDETGVFGITVERPEAEDESGSSGSATSTTGLLTGWGGSLSAPAVSMPSVDTDGLPLAPIALFIVLVQVGVVLYVRFSGGSDSVQRDRVMRTMSHIKEEIHRDDTGDHSASAASPSG